MPAPSEGMNRIAGDAASANGVTTQRRRKSVSSVAEKFDLPFGPPPPVPAFNDAADAFIKRRSALGVDGKPMRRSWKDDRARLDGYLRPQFGRARQVFLAVPELSLAKPWRAMFAVGTFCGLRTGEVIALQWSDLDLAAKEKTIHVRRSIGGPLKDDESRIAPIPESLAKVLREWRRFCPVGSAQVFPPTGRRGNFVKEHTLGKVLRAALAATKLPRMKWYECTRHSFASRWVQGGGSLMKLAIVLGHSAAETTLRYAHLQPGNFTEQERRLADVYLGSEAAEVVPLRQESA